MRRLARLLLLLALASGFALAQGKPHIEHAWARATVQGQRVGGAYFEIDNRGGGADKLLAVESPVAESAQLHRMEMQGNVMHMREAGAIEVPAGGKLALEPAGLHVMLMGLKAPLKVGQRFPLTLRFQKAGEVEVDVKVESAIPAGPDLKH